MAMIETDTLLVKCPRCGAWPMAANLQRTSSAQQDIRFRCPRCHGDEAGRLHRPFAQRNPQRDLDAA
ncbi:phage FluMu protein Com [Bradyrhizobium japonicum]